MPKVRLLQPSDGSHAQAFLCGALVFCLAACAIASWVFALNYVPTLADAHASVFYAEHTRPWLATVRGIKHFAESGAVIASGLLLAAMWWRSTFTNKDGVIGGQWFAALTALQVVLAWSFFGQLLPMDQTAWHGTVVRSGIVSSIPITGEWLRDWLFAGTGISGQTLTRFFAMHTAVLPPVLLLCAAWLWRTRPLNGNRAFSIGIGGVGVTLLALALAWPAAYALDIAARPGQPMNDVRPEWFFLPLSMMLRYFGGGFLESLVVGLPGLVLSGLGFLPILMHSRWARPSFKLIGRAKLLVFAAVFAGLLALGVGSDIAAQTGYARKPRLDDIMTTLGRLNETLGQSSMPAPESAYRSVPDLVILSRQTASFTNHEKSKDPNQWTQHNETTLKASLALWSTPPGNLTQARRDLRLTCKGCHDACGEEDIDLFEQWEPVLKPKPDVLPPPPAAYSRLDSKQFEGLKPFEGQPAPSGTSRIMKRMGRSYKALNEGELAASPQAWLDLDALAKLTGPLYDDADGGFSEFAPRETWDKAGVEMASALKTMREAQNEKDYRDALEKLRLSCGSCHDAFGVDEKSVKLAPVKRD